MRVIHSIRLIYLPEEDPSILRASPRQQGAVRCESLSIYIKVFNLKQPYGDLATDYACNTLAIVFVEILCVPQ